MNLTRVWAIFLRQLYLMRGSFTRIIPLFVWISVDMILWGFTTRYLNQVSSAGFDFVPVLLGAILLWDFFSRVMQGVTTAFFEDIWTRNFLNLFAAPLSTAEYTGGLVLSSIITSAAGLIVMLLLTSLIFGLSFAAYGIALLPLLLILFMSGIALGIVGVAIVLRFGPAAEWLIWPLPALMSPFVGVFYPLSVMPGWMQAVAHALPPAYVFEQVRAVAEGRAPDMAALLIGTALAAFYILLAGWFFSRIFRHALETGLIARYSAESVN